MNFLDKLSKYNQSISFNIFAFNGYITLLVYIYFSFFLEPKSTDWILWFCICAILTVILLFAFIFYCVEITTKYKLPFKFLKSKQYTFILLFGALISIIYLLLLIMFLIEAFIIMPLFS